MSCLGWSSRLSCARTHSVRTFLRHHSLMQRSLRLESLEQRYTLSADLIAGLDPCPATGPTVTEASVQTPVVETVAESSSSSDFVGPLEADAYFAAISEPQSASAQFAAEGEGTPMPNGPTPPVLLNFMGTRNEMYWILSGNVSDDLPPPNCIVEFGGILAGQTASVASNGYFSTFIPYNPSQQYEVSAVARDSNGNYSNMLTINLIP